MTEIQQLRLDFLFRSSVVRWICFCLYYVSGCLKLKLKKWTFFSLFIH